MSVPIPVPKFAYKILPEAPPNPLPESLPLSELDATDGFIHLSTAKQVPATAGRFYSTNSSLWLLKIPLDRIQKDVRWEGSAGGHFPHVYGAMPGKAEIVDSKEFRNGEGEDWANKLENDQWLV